MSNDLSAKLSEIRRQRRLLIDAGDDEDTADQLKRLICTIENGPNALDDFDEVLFADMIDSIFIDSQESIRFKLAGGIELPELINGAGR